MNKELIKKYKDIFDYWLDGGKVIAKNTRVADTWVEVDCDEHWDCTDINDHKISFVKNDQYAEFRKALADGKIIQLAFRETCCPIKWKDITDWGVNIPMFPSPVEDYRIKPDESKFKVGDWLKDSYGVYVQVTYVSTNMVFYVSSEGSTGSLDLEYILENNIKPWGPKPGEWCWFWDNLSNHMKDTPQLLQFKSIDRHVRPYLTSPNGRFGNCEPFVGTLPSGLKD